MAKDYFQDIIPPDDAPRRIPIHKAEPPIDSEEGDAALTGDRSIRNININPRGRRRSPEEIRQMTAAAPRMRRRPRRWIWALAAVCVLALAALGILAMRSTRVTVTPRTHQVVFDDSSVYTAYPAATAATGTLAYTVQNVDLEDSDIVQASGTVHEEDKASGQVTVYNNFQSALFKLVKNTRFSTPDGLIFRAPADILVPGKTSSGPGQITVTVIADAAGDQYNSGSVSKLTVPGLKSSPDTYANIYAAAPQGFSGGFSGDRPGVAQADRDATLAAIRNRLQAKAIDAAKALSSDTAVVFPDLIQIAYEDEPDTQESGNSARIHEKAHLAIPILSAPDFARAVALSVSSDAENASLRLVPGEGYGAHLVATSTALGTDPLQFGLIGKATIVWNVDAAALAQALAGKDQGAFQTIVNGFTGIQEAHARIEPFWSTLFPKDPGAIKVKVVDPLK
ncbi:MAG: baseplate J/gp47 family protein [Candidatus Kaiserbacteria bacterium]|nr:baseplate J/gp47 family protein [Candidatus Kaiserbacteria bacterium]